MPRASALIAIAVNPGLLARVRHPNRTSSKILMQEVDGVWRGFVPGIKFRRDALDHGNKASVANLNSADAILNDKLFPGRAKEAPSS